ncbi:MAG: ATP-binding protein [Pirellulales bacterium]
MELLCDRLARHFRPGKLEELTVVGRQFPYHMRVDLQQAIERFLDDASHVACCGVKASVAHHDCDFASIFADDRNMPAKAVPVQYEDVDTGGDRPARCATGALWTVDGPRGKFALLYTPAFNFFERTSQVRVQLAAPETSASRVAEEYFRLLEQAIERATAYRGKILSFEQTSSYRGESRGITVHRLQGIARDQVILPRKTLDLLDRNVLDFVARRPRLRELGMSTKKGLLFYGPPGTGKTHTIHYLAGALQGHTVLLISAEQVALLSEYMTLARLLQPSVVVLEDVDLIARERSDMESACEEVLLNKLLNEMDGLKEQADILFILTTNRPETLERAISSRPGRVDQAIEFPLPDEEGRAKLVRLYARGASISDDLVQAIVARTGQVSAAFIKELMRRTAQFHLERSGDGALTLDDVDRALDEMLFAGGSLNLKLLGAEGRLQPDASG